MANAARGEVAFRALDRDWTLLLDINALCEAEDELGVKVHELAQPGLKAIRALLWAGLQRHQQGVTITQAGDIIQAVGMALAAEIVGEAFTLTFPEAAKGVAGPRKAAARKR